MKKATGAFMVTMSICKLKNRRVMLGKRNGAYYLKFKVLDRGAARRADMVRVTDVVLTQESMDGLVSLYFKDRGAI